MTATAITVPAPTARADHEWETMIGPGRGAPSHERPSHERPDRGGRRGARLAEIRATGLVRRASEQDNTAVERSLPVMAALRSLLPGGCLRRGSTVVIAGPATPGPAASGPRSEAARAERAQRNSVPVAGSTSLLFGLLAEASAAGSWCAVVGLPTLGLVAAAEAGVAIERLALVPHPGPEWTGVVAALLDGVDIVVAATPGPVPARAAERLAARARQRGVVLVPVGRWPGADLTLEVVDGAWHGLGDGWGRLRGREVEVVAYGRGAAARTRRAHLWLPGATGSATPSRSESATEPGPAAELGLAG